jgi:hypothetical protein
MDDGVQIVGESKEKKANKLTMEPVVINPLKFVYQARFSDEFLRASKEQKLNYLKAFNDGAAVQYAKALDLAAFHGINPYTGQKASFYATNSIDGVVGITKAYNANKLDDDLDEVIGDLDTPVNGLAFSKKAGSAMGKIKVNGVAQYPEFKFGGNPGTFAGINCDVNTTISEAPTDAEKEYEDEVIVGDFTNAYKWGYAAEMPLEVIEYGDPDNTGRDLKAYNEVCLRLEAYIGWGILDPTRFAIIGESEDAPIRAYVGAVNKNQEKVQNVTYTATDVDTSETLNFTVDTEDPDYDGYFEIAGGHRISITASAEGYETYSDDELVTEPENTYFTLVLTAE